MVKEREKLKERQEKAHLLIWNCVVDKVHASNPQFIGMESMENIQHD